MVFSRGQKIIFKTYYFKLMKNHFLLLGVLLLVFGCYSIPELPNFDVSRWSEELNNCQSTKLDLGQVIIANQDRLFGEGQAEIKALLGQPDENELYLRNQKFFYYDLTLPTDSCDGIFQRLSIRFDALDRVKEIMIIEGRS